MTQTALTLSEAATACGVSRSTVKRKLSEFGNAYQDSAKVWKVPISDLLASGLTLRRPTLTEGDDPAVNGADQGQTVQVERLTAELAAERERRLVAETKVMLLTANLEDLRYSLRAISGPPRAPEPDPEAPGPQGGKDFPPGADAPPEAALVGPRRAMEPIGSTPPRRGLWARIRGT